MNDDKLEKTFLWFAPIVSVFCIIIGVVLDGTFLIYIALFLLIIWFMPFSASRNEKKSQQALEAKNLAAKAEQDRLNAAARDGSWQLPIDDFCKQCSNLTSFDSSFAMQKASAVVTSILKKNNIPEDAYPKYLNDEKLRDYLSILQKRVEEEKRNEHLRRTTPQIATLTKKQKSVAEYNRPRSAAGKRVGMIRSMLSSISCKIVILKQGQEAMQQLAFIMSQSAYTEPKNDWALMGGIASGLAGPAAGIAAATSAIAENERIEAQNRRNREAVNANASKMLSNSISLGGDISALEEQQTDLRDLLEAQEAKVIFDSKEYTEQSLFEALGVSLNVFQEKAEDGFALRVKGNVKYNNNLKDLPEVPTTIDGVLCADIYCDSALVGSCYLALPLFGVETSGNGTYDLEGISDRYMVDRNDYTVTVRPHSLCLMEL